MRLREGRGDALTAVGGRMYRGLGRVEVGTKTPDFLATIKAIKDEEAVLVFEVCVCPHIVLDEISVWFCEHQGGIYTRECPQYCARLKARYNNASFHMRSEK